MVKQQTNVDEDPEEDSPEDTLFLFGEYSACRLSVPYGTRMIRRR
jgi:hypothetical protein